MEHSSLMPVLSGYVVHNNACINRYANNITYESHNSVYDAKNGYRKNLLSSKLACFFVPETGEETRDN